MTRAAHASVTSQKSQWGLALLAVVAFLLLFSALALGLAFSVGDNAAISSNHRQQLEAAAAAEAGLAMARSVLGELDWTAALRGPNGVWETDAAMARAYSFRSPVAWNVARILPAGQAPVWPNDDGQLFWRGAPLADSGWALSDRTRFFLKITNNPEDPAGPSTDSDDLLTVRSLGLSSRPLHERARNAVAVREARLRRDRTFELPAALVLVGPGGETRWENDLLWASPSAARPAVVVADSAGAGPLESALRESVVGREDRFQGLGANPSIQNLSALFISHPHYQNLFRHEFLSHFLEKLPLHAKMLGQPQSSGQLQLQFAPDDLVLEGPLEMAGILVCAGRLTLRGSIRFEGLLLVVGRGQLVMEGESSVRGGILIARLESSFLGFPSLNCSARGSVLHDAGVIENVLKLFPPAEIWSRIVTPELDPP